MFCCAEGRRREIQGTPLPSQQSGPSDGATALATAHHSFLGSFSDVSKRNFVTKYAFFQVFRDLQSPLSGEKKVQALFFSRKKNTFGGELRLGHPSRQRRAPRAPWGLPTPDVGSTLGQRSVNVRSTLGIFPSHRGPIFADFAGFVE